MTKKGKYRINFFTSLDFTVSLPFYFLVLHYSTYLSIWFKDAFSSYHSIYDPSLNCDFKSVVPSRGLSFEHPSDYV